MGGLVELFKNSKLCVVRFAKYARQNHKGELAKLDRAPNSAPRGFATLSKKFFFDGRVS